MEASGAFSLTNKTILVTGASSGIGRQVCISLATAGAFLFASGRDEARLRETLRLSGGPPGKHNLLLADLTDEGQRKDLAENTGSLDGIVHCAGAYELLPFRFYTGQKMRHYNGVNYEAPVLLTNNLLKAKKLNNNASVVFISSISSIIGVEGNGIYAGTKAALVAVTRAMALELAPKKIRVNCISPGLVFTPLIADEIDEDSLQKNILLHPLGLGEPADVANACHFLLSDASKWITGTNLIADGGYTAR